MTSPWVAACREATVTGTLASVLSTLALAAFGRRETGAAAVPSNATSHWIWGDEALDRRQGDLRHTVTGYAIHHVAVTFWAVLHARAMQGRPQAGRPLPALAAAAATAALACVVDLRLTPHRLTPGFEHRLSTLALVAVYGSVAAGLAAGSLAVNRRRGARQP